MRYRTIWIWNFAQNMEYYDYLMYFMVIIIMLLHYIVIISDNLTYRWKTVQS